ncbi:hypothetical protein [Pseudooceanicola sp. MF1-13]|uniref:hypothetical protein n=1 Tax=Pseudooceanicola sp. MF1-13 TaxID=3379095 RepID=UPI00389122EA
MKRIAALSLVAAMAATGASANNATAEQPTVSTQVGLLGSAFGPAAAIIGLTVVAVVVAAADNASGT